jgi:tetratricopeptide (TPR) repeat protein
MFKRAFEGWEKTLGLDHTLTLRTITNLGVVYRKQGRLLEAEAMYKRAFKGHEKALGSDHTLTLQTISNLGVVY